MSTSHVVDPEARAVLRAALVVLTDCCNRITAADDPDTPSPTETILVAAIGFEVSRWLGTAGNRP